MGGELINLVYDMMLYNSGDSKVHVLLSKLLKEASRPYMHALYKWLNNGDVDDPYEEFMIVAGAAATESEESPFAKPDQAGNAALTSKCRSLSS
jgi:hypothetical protein